MLKVADVVIPAVKVADAPKVAPTATLFAICEDADHAVVNAYGEFEVFTTLNVASKLAPP